MDTRTQHQKFVADMVENGWVFDGVGDLWPQWFFVDGCRVARFIFWSVL